ncbi:MAG: ABC transporter ATP-binding protein [Clostridia bacterium]|nr:ABC transporter ATP-binding protein [Clostridia bacterium]
MPPGRNMRPMAKPKDLKGTIRRMFSYVGKDKYRLIAVFICIAVSAVISAVGTYMLKDIIDGYIRPLIGLENPDFGGLLYILSVLALMYLVSAIAAYINSRLMMKISTGTMNRIRKDLFDHMQSLPLRFFDTHTHGELMSRFSNDTDTLREFLSQSLPQTVSSVITLTSTLVGMLRLSWLLTIILFALLPINLVVISAIGKRSGRYFAAQQKAVGDVNGYIEEMMAGQRVVKVFNHEQKAQEEFDERNERLREAGTQANTLASILMPIMANLGNIQYVVIAIVGAALLTHSNLIASVGSLVAFMQYARNFSMPITQLSQQFNAILLAMAGAERVFEIMDLPPEIDNGYVQLVNAKRGADGSLTESETRTGLWAWKHPHSADGSITYTELKGDVVFEDVTFGYVPEKTVLHNISLYARPGQKIAFVGSTGAGKTTITNLINRFYEIQGGKIRYDGINIGKIKKDDLRRSLGMVLQDTHLFTGTVRENIRYGKLDATDEEIERAAKIANADFFIRHLPEGYDTMLTNDGANLSQGQRQLLAIARAAVADPPVLILDEATSSIDTRTEALIEKGMDGLMKGRTVFVIAHRLSTVRNSQAIMVLENGRIIERGDHEALIEQKGRYYQLYTGMFELS